MTGKSVIGLVLLTSTFLSSSAKAAALTSAFEELRQKAANSGEVFDCAEGTETTEVLRSLRRMLKEN